MSIFGTLLGLFGAGAAFGAADLKSKRDIQKRQAELQRPFGYGCDPTTEYKLACEAYDQIIRMENVLFKQIQVDMKTLTPDELKAKYPDAFACKEKQLRDWGEPDLEHNERQRKIFFDPKYRMFYVCAIEEAVKRKFLSDEDRLNFKEGMEAGLAAEANPFERSVAALVAARKMQRKGFTPVASAKYCMGGVQGFATSQFNTYPPRNYMLEFTANPSPEQIQKAMKMLGYVSANRRDGAALDPEGKSQKERQDAEEKRADLKFLLILWGIAIAMFVFYKIIGILD